MPELRYSFEDVVAAQERGNQILEAILAKVSAVLTVTIVEPNAPPQYTGPSDLGIQVRGTTTALQGMDPDGDPITWSMDGSNFATISSTGVVTWTAAGSGSITVWLDDGKA